MFVTICTTTVQTFLFRGVPEAQIMLFFQHFHDFVNFEKLEFSMHPAINSKQRDNTKISYIYNVDNVYGARL